MSNSLLKCDNVKKKITVTTMCMSQSELLKETITRKGPHR